MKTLKEPSPTQEKLFDAARDLMLEKGFVATTVDEICEAAGVTKGSFFHYFDSKEDLAKQLVVRFAKGMGKTFENACCSEKDPLDRVYTYIDCAIEHSKKPESKGCLIGTFAQELSESHPEIRNICSDIFQKSGESMKADLAAAKEKYAPKSKIDVLSLAETFTATVQGSMILMKAKKDKSVMRRTLTHYRQYLKTIFGR